MGFFCFFCFVFFELLSIAVILFLFHVKEDFFYENILLFEKKNFLGITVNCSNFISQSYIREF
jgi:hypothetical protein